MVCNKSTCCESDTAIPGETEFNIDEVTPVPMTIVVDGASKLLI
jgi:hypothetical protein